MPPNTPSGRTRPLLEKSTTVKRRWRRSNQRFTFTATQVRRIERSEELENKAKQLREKEKRRSVNKKKKAEREAKEREERRKAGLPLNPRAKVTASQQRLSQFFGGNQAVVSGDDIEDDGEEYPTDVDSGYSDGDESTGDLNDAAGTVSAVHETDVPPQVELEDCFSSSPSAIPLPSSQERANNGRAPDEGDAEILRQATNKFYDQLARLTPRKDTAQIVVAAAEPSQSSWDFDIANDSDIEEELQTEKRTTARETTLAHNDTSPRKRKALEEADEVGAKRSRVLSEMSPSRVNIRAQETLSPFKAQASNSPAEDADDILAMITTQDLESDKENLEPQLSSTGISADRKAPISPDDKHFNEQTTTAKPSPLRKQMSINDLDDLLDFDDHAFGDYATFKADELDANDDFGFKYIAPDSPTRRRSNIRSVDVALPPDIHAQPNLTAPSSSYSFSLPDEETLKLLDTKTSPMAKSTPRPKKKRGRTLPWRDGVQHGTEVVEADYGSFGLDEEDLFALDV